jgi:hypothetical protein
MLLLLGCGIMIAILLYNDSVFYSLLFDEVLISLELIYSGNEFKEVHQVNYKLIKFESVTILEYYFAPLSDIKSIVDYMTSLGFTAFKLCRIAGMWLKILASRIATLICPSPSHHSSLSHYNL